MGNRTSIALPENLGSLLTRIMVWVLLGFALYLLRSFFLLIFLTFVFAYIQAHAADKLANVIGSRTLRVVLVALAFLGILLSIGAFVAPRIKEQAEVFSQRHTQYLRKADNELVRLSAEYPFIERLVPDLNHIRGAVAGAEEWTVEKSPSSHLVQRAFGFDDPEHTGADMREAFQTLRNVGGSLLGVVSAFLLALLFSFLIVLDLPGLTRGVLSLSETRLKVFYEEVGDSIYQLARTIGRALEAQLLIAIVNMVLTAIGIYAIGIRENLVFISVIVFLCSFIPVAGVFISSAPICLMALQQGGFPLMLLTALLIWIIHLIEAYILNPKIYGHHLRINAVLVLIILTIAGKLFGVWGLVLGLPVCRYIFGYAIQYRRA
ncbi:MAG: AI-2E family transporter [Oligoflexia bacterium]|nr:AI-2E family transporter [Oligoflexia bacterium]